MGGCQGKAKKKSRNGLQYSDSRATKNHPVVTFKQQKQRKSLEIKNTNPGYQTGKDTELLQTKVIHLAKQEDLDLSEIKVIPKVQDSQKQRQNQNDTLHYTNKKDATTDSVEQNGEEVKKIVTEKQDETQEKMPLEQDETQEKIILKQVETQEKTTLKQDEVQEDGVVPDVIQDTKPKVIHFTSNNNGEANYESRANFAKGHKPTQNNGQSLQPPSIDGQSMQTASQRGQPNSETQRNNNSVVTNQQGSSSGNIATLRSSTGVIPNPQVPSSDNHSIPRNEGLHVQQPESATYQIPESQNSRGTNNTSSTFEPCQPTSNQLPKSENTRHMLNGAHQNPGPSGTQSGSDLNDNTGNAGFAQPTRYEDDDYRKMMGLAGEESDEFEGFRTNEKSKRTKPYAKINTQNKGRKQSDDSDSDDDDDDDDDDDTDSDDDADSDESSSDEEPQKKHRKKKRRHGHGKIQITNITGAQFAAIGKHAKYIDKRVVIGPDNKTKKTKKKMNAKPKPSNKNQKEKNNTKHQENTESHVKPPNNVHGHMRPNNTDRIQNLSAIVEASKSVGIIFGPDEFSGTVFRVGDEYVMTAWHVVKHLIAEGTPPNTYDNELNLSKEDIFIDFKYLRQRPTVSDRHKFSLIPAVEYCNADLDIAVLRLKKKENEDFPAPLIHFKNIIPEHYKKPIYLVGHTGGEPKEDDPKITIWNPYLWRLEELRKWSLENFHRDGYSGMNHPNKFIFDCTFRHGASGSPGFSHAIGPDNEDIPVVVTVLLRGFPDFYYFADFSDSEKAKVPPEMLKQQGVRIEAVMKHMEPNYPSLYQNIFCRSPYAQPDVSRSRAPLVISRSHGNTIPQSPISSPVTEGPSSIIPSNTSGLVKDVVQQY